MDIQELQRIKNKFDIIGNDPELNRAIETAVAIAPTDLSILIGGESGVGKEIIPQIIHYFSRRKTGKYLAVNCGAIPSGTISAELFGHEKGSFTGAIGEHKGYFEEANGGTLFLDEIGELPKETQAMLLRVLQTGEYLKVGSSKVEKTDVRVIAATNVNLPFAVSQGKFREDLYYRLSGLQISVPSLRDRKDDICLLFRKFSSDFSEKYSMRKLNLSIEAIAALTRYRWPGNVRQLKNVAETITAIESEPISAGHTDRIDISLDTLKKYLPMENDSLLPAMSSPVSAGATSSLADADKQMIVKAILDLKQEVDQLRRSISEMPKAVSGAGTQEKQDDAEWQEPEEERQLSIRKSNDDMIKRALEKHGGNVKAAAAELGISDRTLYRRLSKKKQN